MWGEPDSDVIYSKFEVRNAGLIQIFVEIRPEYKSVITNPELYFSSWLLGSILMNFERATWKMGTTSNWKIISEYRHWIVYFFFSNLVLLLRQTKRPTFQWFFFLSFPSCVYHSQVLVDSLDYETKKKILL